MARSPSFSPRPGAVPMRLNVLHHPGRSLAPLLPAAGLAAIAAVLAAAADAPAATRRVPEDLPLIQWALNESAPGDTVLVSPGDYTQNLTLPPGVTLRSAGGAAVTRLVGSGLGGGIVVTDGGAGTRIQGFSILGYLDGIVAIGGAPAIEGNVVTGSLIAGIDLADSSGALLRDNVIAGNPVGLVCDAGSNPLVERNTLVRNGTGISIIHGSLAELRANIVALNEGAGIYAESAHPVLACNDVWGNGQDYAGDLGDSTGTAGNISADPWFCSPSLGRFGLRQGSPCAADAPGACGRRGAYEVECEARLLRVNAAGAADFATVGAAVAAAVSPDSVEIAPGLYPESLTLAEAIVLRGAGGDPAGVVIDGGGAPHALHAAGVDSAGEVRALTLRGGTGAALRVTGGSSLRVTDVLLVASVLGARVEGSAPRFEGVTAAGCVSDGVRVEAGSALAVERSLFAANGGAGLRALGGAGATVSCTAFHGNDGGAVAGMADPVGTAGNIAANPLFCDPEEGVFTLRAESPCLPDTASCGARGALGLGCPRKVWTVYADGSGEAPTIAAAIESCLAADTVRVGPGVYAESLALAPDLVLLGRDGALATRITLPTAGEGLTCTGCGPGTEVRGLTFAGFASAGLRFTSPSGARVRGVRFEANGAGARVFGGHADFDSCLWWENALGLQGQADSVAVTRSTFHAQEATSVLVGSGCAARVERNIVSASGTAGIRVLAGGTALLECNDVWSLTGSPYVGTGPGPGDIAADPRFCDAEGGDFGLMTDSPCAPGASGSCGLIGMRPVSCGPGTGVHGPAAGATPAEPRLSLALAGHPSAAGSRLELRAPPGSPGAELGLYDARGRRLWREALRLEADGTARLSWPPADAGALAPGVYFLLAESAGSRARLRWVLAR